VVTPDQFSSLGLTLATVASISNVIGEVLRKQIVGKHSATSVTFAYRFLTMIMATGIVLVLAARGQLPTIKGTGAMYGWVHLPPLAAFIVLMVLVTLILGYATWAHLRAFQLSEMSTTAPLQAFIPVFTLLTGWLTFSELPSIGKILGILLVVAGAYAIHVDLLTNGWLAPLRAIFVEAGSRYMMVVAVLYSISGPVEKQLALMGGPFVEALWYAFGMVVLFGAICALRGENPLRVIADAPWVVGLLAVSDLTVLAAQYAAVLYIPVVANVAIRRVGLIAVVFLGWLIFKEQGLRRKLLGCSVMVVGALLLYLPVTTAQAVIIAALGLAVLVPLAVRARSTSTAV
jgi:drug/metabolite transporter (DMT)-like permease